tara:strand:+ start:180 stop:587 length:408 start_codon:yes stop_codon:yes gene_type:complete
MATQDELDWENTVSRNQQEETRKKRGAVKDIKDRRKLLLQGASGTKERRAIKAAADAALEQSDVNFDEKKYPSDNKQDYESDVQQRGIDQFTAPEATPENTGGGGLPDGYVETAVIICVNGSPVSGQFLFKEDAP